jgi:hypothetical protein
VTIFEWEFLTPPWAATAAYAKFTCKLEGSTKKDDIKTKQNKIKLVVIFLNNYQIWEGCIIEYNPFRTLRFCLLCWHLLSIEILCELGIIKPNNVFKNLKIIPSIVKVLQCTIFVT